MRTVVGFPQFGRLISGVQSGQATEPDFPPANASDLVNLRRVVRAAAAGSFDLTLTLSAPSPIALVTVVHHNAQAGASLAYKMFAGAPNQSGVVAQGSLALSPYAGGPSCTPLLLPAGLSIQSAYLQFNGNGGLAWEIGAVDLSAAYVWGDVDTSMARGFSSRSVRTATAGGIDLSTRQWSPRSAAGRRPLIDRSEQETTALDMQRVFRLSQPFIYVRDIDDAARWPRECFPVVNKSLAPIVSSYDPGGPLSYAFEEHLG